MSTFGLTMQLAQTMLPASSQAPASVASEGEDWGHRPSPAELQTGLKGTPRD